MDGKAVRPFQAGDLDAVMEIWLSANLQAHSFIPEEYWRENAREVRRLLPEAAVYVREEDGVPAVSYTHLDVYKRQGYAGV